MNSPVASFVQDKLFMLWIWILILSNIMYDIVFSMIKIATQCSFEIWLRAYDCLTYTTILWKVWIINEIPITHAPYPKYVARGAKPQICKALKLHKILYFTNLIRLKCPATAFLVTFYDYYNIWFEYGGNLKIFCCSFEHYSIDIVFVSLILIHICDIVIIVNTLLYLRN